MNPILDPGFNLTLRPMRHTTSYDMHRAAIKDADALACSLKNPQTYEACQ
jgi:hypothetical protein